MGVGAGTLPYEKIGDAHLEFLFKPFLTPDRYQKRQHMDLEMRVSYVKAFICRGSSLQ